MCISLILIAGIMLSAGCVSPLASNQSEKNSQKTMAAFMETPTLPDQYIARPAGTLATGSSGNPIPTQNASLPLVSGQNSTITGTGLTGGTENISATVTTNAPIPIAQFTADKTMGFAPLSVQFTDTSLDLPVSWSWDFGDGGSSTLQNPSHTFISGGQFTVTLNAANALGSSDFSNNISVYKPGFSAIPNQGNHPLTVTFTDTGTGYPQPISWYWDFGDGTPAGNQQNITHQYQSPGTYDVALWIASPAGTRWVNQSAAVTVT